MALANEALIIGGQPKAGTSSLFHWLSQHPEISPSRVKEVRFFLDDKYPLPSGARFDGYNEDAYLDFFSAPAPDQILLDATPDYLYCDNAKNIGAVLPNSKLLFVVRDPVERAVSWYKFAAQIGRLEKGMTFEEYIDLQISQEVTECTPIHLRALEQNRVHRYLPIFERDFKGRCLMKSFAQIRNDPLGVVTDISNFVGIDPAFYDDFDFSPQNVSSGQQAPRRARIYYRGRAWFNYLVKPSPQLTSAIRPIGLALKRMLVRYQPLQDFEVSDSLAKRIQLHAES